MQYNSIIFFIFIIVSVLVYYVTPSKFRNHCLLIINYAFYSYFDYRLTFLLIGITSVNYFLGEAVRKSESDDAKKTFVILGVVFNLIILGFFKYFNFFIESAKSFVSFLGWNINLDTLNIILPLGISFYIFQTLTFIFDNYYEFIEDNFNFFEFAVFASFFPTVVAGPIERASRLLPQIKNERHLTSENLKGGFALITTGLVRKVLIADSCGSIINHIFADPLYYKSIEVLIAVLLFTIQVYNDFAGYSSISRGVGMLFGFDIMINFRQPYFANSVSDFWRRWHISLSTWLRDYLFKPLQMKFRDLGNLGNALAIMITFILCGLWHGASWNFIIWGFLHGFFMSFAIMSKNLKDKLKSFITSPFALNILQVISTLFLIILANVFFRTTDINHASQIFSQIFSFSHSEFAFRFIKIFLTYSVVSFTFDYFEMKYKSDYFIAIIPAPIKYGFIVSSWFLILLFIFSSDKLPFLYGQF